MVVCKCRKATRLYCFVHKVPVCGECICHSEHLICVVKKYSDWVVDGEYDWPPTCSLCHEALQAGSDSQTTRLGCLHIMHTDCLVSHIQSFPPQTVPAGYFCPACSTPLWPPSSVKDTGSLLHSKLKEAVLRSGLEKNVFGNHLISFLTGETQAPPAFDTDPLVQISPADGEGNKSNGLGYAKDSSLTSSSSVGEEKYSNDTYPSKAKLSAQNQSEPDIVEISSPTSTGNQLISTQGSNFKNNTSLSGKPNAATRKSMHNTDRQYSESSYYADDEDGNYKKYNRRGPFHHKLLRMLLPFWSPALPTLPVTAPQRKDGENKEVSEGRPRRQRASSRTDPRRVLLIIALLACLATMGILYYRLAMRSLSESLPEDEVQ